MQQYPLTRPAGASPRTFQDQVSAQFAALESIRLGEIKSLLCQRVGALALIEPELPARARVSFVDGRPWFDFSNEIDDDRPTESALIFLARDEAGEPADLVGWAPKSGRVGSWLARAPVLGLETAWAPRIAYGGATPIYESPLRWLQDGRDGVLLIDAEAAAPIIRGGGPWLAESIDLGERVLALAISRTPRVLARTVPTETATNG